MICLAPAEAYELWADSYDDDHNPVLALEGRTLKKILGALSPGTVVDVGCGTGRSLRSFVRNGVNSVGLDVSPGMLARANARTELRGRLVLAHAAQIPLCTAVADLVLCSMTLAYCDDLGAVLGELSRVTTPGGNVIVTDLHPAAAQAGWTRSFHSNGVHYEIAHRPYAVAHLQQIAKSAGLVMQRCESLHFDEEELPIFRDAGKEMSFPAIAAIPALLLGVWQKPC